MLWTDGERRGGAQKHYKCAAWLGLAWLGGCTLNCREMRPWSLAGAHNLLVKNKVHDSSHKSHPMHAR